MILIIGGAYQGKLDYAREHYGVGSDIDFLNEGETVADFYKGCLYGYDKLILSQLRAGIDPYLYLEDNMRLLKEKIIIADDISSGIVPIDDTTRQWREAAGRILTKLAACADEVVRVFCGLGTKLK